MRLTDHFTEQEFTCPCGCETLNVSPSFIKRLERARVIAGIPFKVVSGCRCTEHNSDVDGKDSSAHLADEVEECHAADIGVRGSRQRFKVRKALLDAGFTRIGTGDSFLHADDDPTKDPMVEWLY